MENNNTTERPWGYFINLTQGDGYLVKIIHVNPKQKLSVQSHNYRSEHWVAVKGTASVILNSDEISLQEGECIDIPIKAVHSLQNLSDDAIEIIEIQRGEVLSEDDIIRYSDIYGRV